MLKLLFYFYVIDTQQKMKCGIAALGFEGSQSDKWV